MAHRGAAFVRQPRREERDSQGQCRFRNNGGSKRAPDHQYSFSNDGRHDCFLSLRVCSISALSASRSSSLHEPSLTREVIICWSEPPKNVCRYCCNAVR